MKKTLALLLSLCLVFAFAACGNNDAETATETATDATEVAQAEVMSYEEYMAAELDSPVVVEAYVQGKQSWWDNKATVYAQDEDGAYFLYDMACSEEDYELLTVGTKIRVEGYKAEWSGEIEIIDATFEIVEGNYVAEALDVTELLGTEELINYQNQLVAVKGMTVEAVEYKNEEPGDDIYLTLGLNGESYSFCVEVYLTGTETDVYNTVGTLEAGNKVDVEGFLYWYNGANPHITSVTVVE